LGIEVNSVSVNSDLDWLERGWKVAGKRQENWFAASKVNRLLKNLWLRWQ
jgi:hypothetical protein